MDMSLNTWQQADEEEEDDDDDDDELFGWKSIGVDSQGQPFLPTQPARYWSNVDGTPEASRDEAVVGVAPFKC